MKFTTDKVHVCHSEMIEFDKSASTELPKSFSDDVSIESQWSDEHTESDTGSLQAGQPNEWPIISCHYNDESNLALGTTAWTCLRCDYRNMNVLNATCALCGMKRTSPKKVRKKQKLVSLTRVKESRHWRTPFWSPLDFPRRQKAQVAAHGKQMIPFNQHTLSTPSLARISSNEQQQSRTSPTLSSHFSKNEKMMKNSSSSSSHSNDSTVTTSNLARDQMYQSRQFQVGFALEKGSSVPCYSFDQSKVSFDEEKRGRIRAPQPAMDPSDLEMRSRFPKNETRQKKLLTQITDEHDSDKFSACSGFAMDLPEKGCNSTIVVKIASEDVPCSTHDNDLNTMEDQTNQVSTIWEILSLGWKLDDVNTNPAWKRGFTFSNQSQFIRILMFSVGLGILVIVAILSFILIRRYVSASRLPISLVSP